MGRAKIIIKGESVQEIGYRVSLLTDALNFGISNFYAYNAKIKNKQAVIVLLGAEKETINDFYNHIKENIPEDAVVSDFEMEDFTSNVMDIDRYLHLIQIEQLNKGIPTPEEDEDRLHEKMLKRIRETEAAGECRQDTAAKLAEQLYPYINEIMTVGLRTWLESHPELQIKITTNLLTIISGELLDLIFRKLQAPKDIPTWLTVTFIQQEGSEIMAWGIDHALVSKSYILRGLYNEAKSKKPDIQDLDNLIPLIQKKIKTFH